MFVIDILEEVRYHAAFSSRRLHGAAPGLGGTEEDEMFKWAVMGLTILACGCVGMMPSVPSSKFAWASNEDYNLVRQWLSEFESAIERGDIASVARLEGFDKREVAQFRGELRNVSGLDIEVSDLRVERRHTDGLFRVTFHRVDRFRDVQTGALQVKQVYRALHLRRDGDRLVAVRTWRLPSSAVASAES